MRSYLPLRLVIITACVTPLVCATPRLASGQTSSLEWVHQFGDPGTLAQRASVAAVGNSVYVTGHAIGGQPYWKDFLRAYSDTGTFKWVQDFPPNASAGGLAPAVAANASRVCMGGMTLTALPPDSSSGLPWQNRGFVRCYNPDGTIQGTGYVEADYVYPIQPQTLVMGIAIAPDAVYVVGYTFGDLTGSCLGTCVNSDRTGYTSDVFVRKYLIAAGGGLTQDWTRLVDAGGYDLFRGASLDALGSLRVWGTSSASGGNNKVVLRCYHPDGSECAGTDIPFVSANEYPFSGGFGPDAFYVGMVPFGSGQHTLRKYTLAGGAGAGSSPDWTVPIIPATAPYALAPEVGGVVVAGTRAMSTLTGPNACVLRYDGATGNLSWSQCFGQTYGDNAFGVALDSDRMYVSGITAGSLEPGVVLPLNTTQTFVARMLRPEQGISDLISRIRSLIADGTLNPGQGQSLTVKLEEALQALGVGDTLGAVETLQAFISQVNAFRNADIIGTPVGDALVGSARSLIAAASS